jgi:ABC-type lipoprotein export system ATPase subunit
MIVATHSGEVTAYCDRVLELHDGALLNHERKERT